MSDAWKRALPAGNLAFGLLGLFAGVNALGQGGPPPPPPQPVPGLTAAELAKFRDGTNRFLARVDARDGLGPVFNGEACAQCHAAGGVGGAATNLGIARVTRIGGLVNGKYSDLANVGGPVLQAHSLRDFIPNYPVAGEVIPREANFVSRRLTTPVFGDGLIEAIPDATILANAARPQPDGVKGIVNMVTNPLTGKLEIGRFGWKSQVSTLQWFSSDAFLNEMGVTSSFFPNENLPQGRPIPRGADLKADPEDLTGDVAKFTDFMRLLAAPAPQPFTGAAIRGQIVFDQIKCTSCHMSTMQTGVSPIKALTNKPVNLYSDLLLHSMGTGLADGIQQGLAKGDQYRTAPLWGLSKRRLLLHDGRANNVDAAILAHGGEADKSVQRYRALNRTDRTALLEFLNSL